MNVQPSLDNVERGEQHQQCQKKKENWGLFEPLRLRGGGAGEFGHFAFHHFCDDDTAFPVL